MSTRTTTVAGPRRYHRLVGLVLLLLFPLSILFSASSAGAAPDDVEDKDSDLSFYRVASTMMSYFSNAQAPSAGEEGEGGGFSESWAESQFLEDPGSAGSFLGYPDEDYGKVSGWVTSSLSGSSDAIGYGTLLPNDENDEQLSGAEGMQQYAQFGATLNGLGFDGTSTGLSSGFFKVITGGVISALYTFTFVVDIIFAGMLDMLVLLNPFKLFVSGVGLFNREFANGMVGGDTAVYGPLQGLADTVTDWYQFAAMLGWTVMVPLFLSLLLISMLLFKKMDKGSAIKRFCIRLLFLGVGLPLLGSMYTGMVNAMEDATDSGNMGSTRVVMSTYVDFENWALKNRLAVPGGGANAGSAVIGWNAEEDQPTGLSLRSARDSALAINAQALGIEGIDPVVGGSDESWTQAATGAGDEAGLDQSTYAQVNSMLRRFMSVDQVTGATFESDAKSSLTSSSYYTENDSENQPKIEKWFSDFDDAEDMADRGGEGDGKAMDNPVLAVSKGTGLRARNNEEGDTGIYFTTTGDTSVNGCKARISTDSGNPGRCNLAPLAIYNYLNTDFDSTSLTLYSSDQVMSEATRSVHNSVNQVGTGTMGFLYWVNAVVLMGSFVAIGLLYALPLLLANLRRTIQIVVAVPFAALGAIAAIAKVIIYSIVLAMEVVITIFTYKLVQEFLLSLPQLIEAPLAAVLSDPSPDTRQSTGSGGFLAFLLAGQGFTMVVTLVLIAFVIMFTVMALRIRKALVTAIEEASTKMVEKFMDTSIGSPKSGGGMMSNAGKALTAGAGAGIGGAAANRMMSNRDGAKKGSSNTGGTNEGPDGIKTDSDVGGKVDTDGKLSTEGKDGDGKSREDGRRDGKNDDGKGLGLAGASATGGRTAAAEAAEGKRVAAEGLSNPPGGQRRDAAGSGMDTADEQEQSAQRESGDGQEGRETTETGQEQSDRRKELPGQRAPVAAGAAAETPERDDDGQASADGAQPERSGEPARGLQAGEEVPDQDTAAGKTTSQEGHEKDRDAVAARKAAGGAEASKTGVAGSDEQQTKTTASKPAAQDGKGVKAGEAAALAAAGGSQAAKTGAAGLGEQQQAKAGATKTAVKGGSAAAADVAGSSSTDSASHGKPVSGAPEAQSEDVRSVTGSDREPSTGAAGTTAAGAAAAPRSQPPAARGDDSEQSPTSGAKTTKPAAGSTPVPGGAESTGGPVPAGAAAPKANLGRKPAASTGKPNTSGAGTPSSSTGSSTSKAAPAGAPSAVNAAKKAPVGSGSANRSGAGANVAPPAAASAAKVGKAAPGASTTPAAAPAPTVPGKSQVTAPSGASPVSSGSGHASGSSGQPIPRPANGPGAVATPSSGQVREPVPQASPAASPPAGPRPKGKAAPAGSSPAAPSSSGPNVAAGPGAAPVTAPRAPSSRPRPTAAVSAPGSAATETAVPGTAAPRRSASASRPRPSGKTPVDSPAATPPATSSPSRAMKARNAKASVAAPLPATPNSGVTPKPRRAKAPAAAPARSGTSAGSTKKTAPAAGATQVGNVEKQGPSKSQRKARRIKSKWRSGVRGPNSQSLAPGGDESVTSEQKRRR